MLTISPGNPSLHDSSTAPTVILRFIGFTLVFQQPVRRVVINIRLADGVSTCVCSSLRLRYRMCRQRFPVQNDSLYALSSFVQSVIDVNGKYKPTNTTTRSTGPLGHSLFRVFPSYWHVVGNPTTFMSAMRLTIHVFDWCSGNTNELGTFNTFDTVYVSPVTGFPNRTWITYGNAGYGIEQSGAVPYEIKGLIPRYNSNLRLLSTRPNRRKQSAKLYPSKAIDNLYAGEYQLRFAMH